LRLGLAVVFLVHGWPKINPNSQMGGIGGVTGFFQQLNVPLPGFFAWVVALLETAGSVLLILGLGTRIVALGFAVDMVVASWLVRIRMMNSPFAGGEGIGWEFEFILGVAALALLFLGAGAYSLDAVVGF
jgi:putative oxidoreductase